ncbi:hypothetical protein [Candidatus Nephthysia bennettiae]|uniref:Uncharacterized protein n=1 Tax=Candidatus Nephthysia bennettiae TaxID=3127016 RepID=A0A934N723_9BACT|nr:hypothetical protein [Candidatus Dormibacteraeota bacterium]
MTLPPHEAVIAALSRAHLARESLERIQDSLKRSQLGGIDPLRERVREAQEVVRVIERDVAKLYAELRAANGNAGK